MPTLKDYHGRVTGSVTIVRRLPLGRARILATGIEQAPQPQWLARCQCGTTWAIDERNITATGPRGCRQCLASANQQRILTNRPPRPLAKKKHPSYTSWTSMIRRCTDVHHKSYPYYGALGVTICFRWRWSFEAFKRDMGERPKGHTLDRIDPNGNYEPGNCRWATPTEQAANKRAKRAY